MFNRNRDRNRKLLTMAGIGLGLAMLRGKRRWRRYAVAQMLGGGFGRGFGRYGGYGRWSQGDFAQMPIPPFIEARLKAWHDKAHGNAPTTPGSQPTDVAQV